MTLVPDTVWLQLQESSWNKNYLMPSQLPELEEIRSDCFFFMLLYLGWLLCKMLDLEPPKSKPFK